MNTKYVTIGIAAVIIIAAVAIVILWTGDDEEEGGETSEIVKGPYRMNDITLSSDIRLVVCGNANNDDVIDEEDLAIVQAIANGEAEWDSEANPLADVYPDGVIDEKDVELLENILAKNECYVYYVDYQGETVRVKYPITGTIGTMYYQQAQLTQLFDLWDNVIACGSGSMSDISNPGWESLISYGTGYNVDPETVAASGVDTILCYTQTDTTAPDLKDLVENTEIDLNVLCINHEQLLRCVATYGFLFDLEDISLEYLALADECSQSLYDCLVDVPTEEQPSIAIVMLYGTATTDQIRVLGYSETGNKHNLAVLINSIPNVNWIRADLDSGGSYGTYVTSEWFLENDPDYIVLVGSGMGASDDMSLEEVQQLYYDKCEEVFGQTRAFQNGNIVCASNGLLNGYSNPLVSLKILSYVYDEIDLELAEEAYNTWYEKYTCFTVEQKPSESVFTVGGI